MFSSHLTVDISHYSKRPCKRTVGRWLVQMFWKLCVFFFNVSFHWFCHLSWASLSSSLSAVALKDIKGAGFVHSGNLNRILFSDHLTVQHHIRDRNKMEHKRRPILLVLSVCKRWHTVYMITDKGLKLGLQILPL